MAARKKKAKKKKARKKKAVAIGRLGPAQNLRPAGAHKDRRRKTRQAEKVEVTHRAEEESEE